jgi:hypothetical protein
LSLSVAAPEDWLNPVLTYSDRFSLGFEDGFPGHEARLTPVVGVVIDVSTTSSITPSAVPGTEPSAAALVSGEI